MTNPGLLIDARPRPLDRTSRPVLIGARILVPGYPQWSWNQRDRAFVLFGSFTTAVLVGVMTWGTVAGMGILAFAFATHVFSAVDAIRQSAFPGFGRFVPVVSTSAGLGAVIYVPALVMASVYAWPITLDDWPREGYLVNRWAYRHQGPRTGETVWLHSKRGSRPKVARIVAGPGQRIEWVDREFRVDDQITEDKPFLVAESPSGLKLTIPEGHVLVVFPANPSRGSGVPGGWEIVAQDDIRGRAWARSYPIWDRRLLR